MEQEQKKIDNTIDLTQLLQFCRRQDFQHSLFPRMEEKYKTFLGKILTGKKAWLALGGIIGMLFLSFMLLGVFPRKVLFFPDNIPNQVIAYIEYPQGTDIKNQQSIVVC